MCECSKRKNHRRNKSLQTYINKQIIMDSTDYRDRNFSLADGLTRKQIEKKLKNDLNHVEVMRNRLKVLTSQADYNKYREQYQSQQIDKHHQVHSEILKEREKIEMICRSRDRSHEKKEVNIRMNQEIKQGLGDALEKMKREKLEQTKQVRLRSQKNSQLLLKRKMKNLEERRLMHQKVKKIEGSIKESISRYASEKKEELKVFKMMEKRSMCELAEVVEKQLKQLSSREQDLINLSSESLAASRMKDLQIKELYGGKGFGKSIHLPGISKAIDQMETENTR